MVRKSSRKIGKIAALVGTEKIGVFKYPVPEVKEDAMLLEVAEAGICGSDLHFYRHPELYDYMKLPTVLGHEVVGRIVETGSKASEVIYVFNGLLEEGDKAVVLGASFCLKCWWEITFGAPLRTICLNRPKVHLGCDDWPHFIGGFADYLYVKPGSFMIKVPEDMPWEKAVLTQPFTTAIRAVEKAMSLPAWLYGVTIPFDGVVVVLGSGTQGILTAAATRIVGAKKIVMTGWPSHRLKLAEKLGVVDETFDISKTTMEERVKEVKEISKNKLGVDVVFECAGAPEAFKEGLKMLRPYGILVSLGNVELDRTIEFSPAQITLNNIIVYGINNAPPQYLMKALNTINKHDEIPFDKIVTHKFQVEETQKAFEAAARQEGLKIVVTGPAER